MSSPPSSHLAFSFAVACLLACPPCKDYTLFFVCLCISWDWCKGQHMGSTYKWWQALVSIFKKWMAQFTIDLGTSSHPVFALEPISVLWGKRVLQVHAPCRPFRTYFFCASGTLPILTFFFRFFSLWMILNSCSVFKSTEFSLGSNPLLIPPS